MTFSCQVPFMALVGWGQFFLFSLFLMTLTVFGSPGHAFCRMSLRWDLSGVSS